MADYGVTDKGFVLKRFDTILEEVQTDVSEAVGFDVRQNPQSMLNSALLVPFCDKIAELWEELQNSYYAKYPISASGINLDNACQYGNIIRKGNLPTEYTIHVTAKEGVANRDTVATKGSLIASITNPVVHLRCVKDVVLSRENCNIIAVKPVIAEAGDYTITVNGQAYSFTAGSETTEGEILTGLATAFEEEGFEKEISDGVLVLSDTEELSRGNEFSLSANLTTDWVTCCVHYQTTDYGDIQLPKGTITSIIDNITGLISVTNKIDPIAGRLVQTDVELRQDYVARSYANSETQTNSIESHILDEVPGVESVRVYENYGDITDSEGRLPHSVEVIVDGGDREQIANAILAKKAGGIAMNGDEVVEVTGEYGDVITVKFRRPDKVLACVIVEITPGSYSLPDDYQDIVTQILLDSDLSIGDSFLSQTYINSIYSALPGIQYCRIKVCVGVIPNRMPVDSVFEEGNITVTQRQKIDLSANRISVREAEAEG